MGLVGNAVRFLCMMPLGLASAWSEPGLLDLTQTANGVNLGFGAGFAFKGHGYLAPLLARHYTTTGYAVRFNLANWNEYEVLNLAATDSSLKGFIAGFGYGDYAHFVSSGSANGVYTGIVVRVDVRDFSTFEKLDLGALHAEHKFLKDAWHVGDSAYVLTGLSNQPAHVVRIDLQSFQVAASVRLTDVDACAGDRYCMKNPNSGFTDGKLYGFALFSSQVARVTFSTFPDLSSVSVFDVEGAVGGIAALGASRAAWKTGIVYGQIGLVLRWSGHVVRFEVDAWSNGEFKLIDMVQQLPFAPVYMFADRTYAYVPPSRPTEFVARIELATIADATPKIDTLPMPSGIVPWGWKGFYDENSTGYIFPTQPVPSDYSTRLGTVLRFEAAKAASPYKCIALPSDMATMFRLSKCPASP